jgi:carboxypeptidase Q
MATPAPGRPMRRCCAVALILAATTPFAPSSLLAQERVDTAAIARIRAEAMDHSQVMDIMSWLTDVYGPRLTWGPNVRKAADWTMTTMKSWGLANVHLEDWYVPNALGWANEYFAMTAVSPNPFIVEAVPRAWSAGTNGKVVGAAVRVQAECLAELEQNYGGKLKNAFVLPTAPFAGTATQFTATGTRHSDSALMNITFPEPGAGGRGGRGAGGPAATPSPVCAPEVAAAAARAAANPQFGGRGGRGGFAFNVTSDSSALRWLENQGTAAILLGGRGTSNSVGGDIATDNGASRVKGYPRVPMVHVATESYGRIARMLEHGVPVTLSLDMQNRFYPADTASFNVIGEIPGTDPALKDEVVMIGGHFDSWHSGTGATDNGAGAGVMLEAMRILKALNLQPRRTIRIGLWTGEEQGLYGSSAYVRQHFGSTDSTGFHPLPEQAKFAAYFNVDNGSGRIRGVYLQGMSAEWPIFDEWMAPFKRDGMRTLTNSNTGGTDHLSFVGVGLPGFQFIQDPLDYGNFTHHTNQDVYERLQPEDMKWNAAVVASFAWQAAQRDEKLPRPPVPTATRGRGGRGGQ